jgi:DNA-binding NarL/FixJ family response regulator
MERIPLFNDDTWVCICYAMDMEKTIRLLIADDGPRARHGLRAILATVPGIEVVGEASSGKEALRLVETHQPDVVLMDIVMPTMDGLKATRAIKERWPEVKVIIITMYSSHREEALAAGADVYLIKGCPPDELIKAILETNVNHEVEMEQYHEPH